MGIPLITVLTPSYNRAHTLGALSDSLLAQSESDFEWLVVDDGSTDGTEALMERLAPQWESRLRYVKKNNGGKHRALNIGIALARGAWQFIVDSDDRLPPGSLAAIKALMPSAAADDIVGIMGLRVDPSGAVIGESLPLRASPVDTASLAFVYGVRGDKAEVFKSAILRRYPFPEIEGERFLTESVAWHRMARDGYKFALTNEPLYICEYLAGGLSDKSLELRLKNPIGNELYYREAIELPFPAWRLLREGVNYCRFLWHDRNVAQGFKALSPRRRLLAALCLPLGWAAFILDKLRLSKKG
ncbi:MAG TPA: glycosyltransferase family 2 protein [Spirochaetaceae bacterium]|jgi:glycosyltransferase involved in cell wall biosynthesis|nr:glycosyltransferase family 2 protein [Spirochaetaceae bacterium]